MQLHASCSFSLRPALGLTALSLLMPLVGSAGVINVNSPVKDANGNFTDWKPIMSASGGYLTDGPDQQTGQADSDFIGTSTNPGFFVQFGTISYGGATDVEHVAMRAMMNEYKTSGNVVNVRFGFDGNGDGKIDLYIGISQQNNQSGMIMNYPNNLAVATSNTSPSTTDWAGTTYPTGSRTGLPALNANNNALALVDGSNFSQIEMTASQSLSTGVYPGWTTQADKGGTVANDAMITFAVPLADINRALTANNAGFQLSSSSFVRWVAVTSTQNQSVNQDAYGYAALSGSVKDIRFDTVVAAMDSNGTIQPVPEPSTYGAVFGGGLAAFLGLRRRRSGGASRTAV